MRKYNDTTREGNSLLVRILGYVFTTFIIPFVILLLRLIAYAVITFVVPFIIYLIRRKIGDQQRLVCNKCHGKLEVVDKGNFYCKNCRIIKFDRQ
jgi:hypothetical protein